MRDPAAMMDDGFVPFDTWVRNYTNCGVLASIFGHSNVRCYSALLFNKPAASSSPVKEPSSPPDTETE